MPEKYHYDKKADALYIWLKEGKEDSFEEIVPGINVELDQSGNVIGIEILHVSRLLVGELKKTKIPSKSSM